MKPNLQHRAIETETVKWDATPRHGSSNPRKEKLATRCYPQSRSPKYRMLNGILVLVNALREEGIKLLGWDEAHTEWQNRVLSIRAWRPDEGWPDVTNENLIITADSWLTPYLNTITKRSELQKLDLLNILTGCYHGSCNPGWINWHRCAWVCRVVRILNSIILLMVVRL
jgi:ATP-dependent helicase HrpB